MKSCYLLLLLGLGISCGASSATNKTVGDEIVLSPGSEVDDIISITWTHNRNIVAEWYEVKPECFRQLKGRCKLDTTTGKLTISGLTLEDSGIYKAEINDKVLNPTGLKVFSPVPKPTVSMSCDDENTHCVLTCEGDTIGVGPVTYTWWSDNKIINESKELIITKEEKEPSFTCVVNNPVSSDSSEEFINPFITNKNQNSSSSTLTWTFVGVVAVVAVGVCVGVVLYIRKCRGRHENQNSSSSTLTWIQGIVVAIGVALYKHKRRGRHVQESSNQEQTSFGQTSSVHLENETETVNDSLLGENLN